MDAGAACSGKPKAVEESGDVLPVQESRSVSEVVVGSRNLDFTTGGSSTSHGANTGTALHHWCTCADGAH